MRLRATQLTKIIEALAILYEPVPLSEFATHVLRSVARVFPDAVLTFDRFHLRSQSFEHTMVGACPPNHQQWLGRLPDVIHQNPVILAASRGGGPVLRRSDLMAEREFMRTDFYHDILKPLDARDQIGCILSHSSGVLGLSINRIKLTAEEQRMAELLYPHLARVYENTMLFHNSIFPSTTPRHLYAQIAPPPSLFQSLGLTDREAEVFQWVLQGKRDCEIALILSRSRRTVEKHVHNILKKLGVETRTAAVLVALERL
jgi:DNA-binding CsgD family transcriptional regulator